jgi:hypothetical protein
MVHAEVVPICRLRHRNRATRKMTASLRGISTDHDQVTMAADPFPFCQAWDDLLIVPFPGRLLIVETVLRYAKLGLVQALDRGGEDGVRY